MPTKKETLSINAFTLLKEKYAITPMIVPRMATLLIVAKTANPITAEKTYELYDKNAINEAEAAIVEFSLLAGAVNEAFQKKGSIAWKKMKVLTAVITKH